MTICKGCKTSIGRWRNYAKQLEPCFETLQPFVLAFGYDN